MFPCNQPPTIPNKLLLLIWSCFKLSFKGRGIFHTRGTHLTVLLIFIIFTGFCHFWTGFLRCTFFFTFLSSISEISDFEVSWVKLRCCHSWYNIAYCTVLGHFRPMSVSSTCGHKVLLWNEYHWVINRNTQVS